MAVRAQRHEARPNSYEMTLLPVVVAWLVVAACTIQVAQGAETCATLSRATGVGLTSATVGNQARFTIEAHDASNAFQTDGTDWFHAFLSGPSEIDVVAQHQPASPKDFVVAYDATKSGTYSLSVARASRGGLTAEWYNNAWFVGTPAQTTISKQIDFNWGMGLITSSAADRVTVRWTGRVVPEFTGEVTFYTRVDDGVRLTVHEKTLVDQLDAVGDSDHKGVLSVSKGKLYRIIVEYKELVGTARLALSWSWSQRSRHIIPSSNFFYSDHVLGSPFTLPIMSTAAVPANCNFTATAISTVEVGVVFMTVNSIDLHGNVRNSGGDAFIVTLTSPTGSSMTLGGNDNGNGTYSYAMNMFATGTYSVRVTLGATDIAGSPHSITTVAAAFCSASSTLSRTGVTLATAGTPSSFTITARDKWGNKRKDGSESILALVYRDTTLVTAWNIADRKDGTFESGGVMTQAGWYTIEVTDATAGIRSHMCGSPFSVYVGPGGACASNSEAHGAGMSLASVGTAATFLITARDAYSATKTIGGDLYSVKLFGPKDTTATVVDNGDGTHTATYTTTQSGAYRMETRLGGVHFLPPGRGVYMSVKPDLVCASKSFIFPGAHLTLTTVGHISRFVVQAQDQWNNRLLDFLPNTYMKLDIGAGVGIDTFRANHSGGYNADYSIPHSGTFATTVELHIGGTDYPVSGSPFTLEVKSTAASVTWCATTSVIYGAGLSLVAVGTTGNFRITARDPSGNLKKFEPTGALGIRITESPTPATSPGSVYRYGVTDYAAAWTATKTGTYQISVDAYTAGGLMATYYGHPGLIHPQMIRVDNNVDFDWGFEVPSDEIKSSDKFSARWKGMVKPQYSEVFTFYLRADDGFRLYFNDSSEVVIDAWDDNSKAEWRVTVNLVAEVLFPIHIEYWEDQVRASVKLSWSSPSTVKSAISSHRLFHSPKPIHASPYTATVGSSGLVCISTSKISFVGVSSTTVGDTVSFTITALDQWGNAGPTGLAFRSRAQTVGAVSVDIPITDVGGGIYTGGGVSFTAAGSRSVSVGEMSVGGLMATYFTGATLDPASAVRTASEANVDFSGNDGSWPSEDGSYQLTDNYPFSVRWEGFVLGPSTANEFTFFGGIYNEDERMRLWVDNSKIIDQWSSLSATQVTGSYLFYAGRSFYDIKFEYKDNADFSPYHQLARLKWEGPTIGLQPISSTLLYRTLNLPGSPYTANVSIGEVCTTTSLVYGAGLSLMTSGVPVQFSVVARDEYNNAFTSGGKQFHARAFASASRPPNFGTMIDNKDGSYALSMRLDETAVPSFTTTLFQAYFTPPGGLSATYWSDDAMTSGKEFRHKIDNTIDFSGSGDGAGGDWPSASSTAASTFSVRWAGFLKPEWNGLYTVTLGAGTATEKDDRVRMWIDSVAVLDMWTSLKSTAVSATVNFAVADSLHEVKIEYKESHGSQAVSLQWHHALLTKRTIPSARLFGFYELPTPTTTTVAGPGAVGSFSKAWGMGLTLATAGVPFTVTVQSRDYYDTLRDHAVVGFDTCYGNNSLANGMGGFYTACAPIAAPNYAYSGVTTHAGIYQHNVQFSNGATGGGLQANYYHNLHLAGDAEIVRHENVDFSWGTGLITPTTSDGISVRWTGLFKSAVTETHVIQVEAIGGVRLIVPVATGHEILNEWDNQGATIVSTTMSLTAGQWYDIVLEYRHIIGEAYVKLSYSSLNTPLNAIPVTSLDGAIAKPANSPFVQVVKSAGTACAAVSTISGSGLTQATIGIPSRFTLTARDIYGNLRDNGPDDFVFRVGIGPGVTAIKPTVTHSSGQYGVLYTPSTPDESAWLEAAIPIQGGIDATYYEYSDFTFNYRTRKDATIDFSGDDDTVGTFWPGAAGDLAKGGNFSVRWNGFLERNSEHTYTFFVTMMENDERCKLWIDNTVVVNMWQSLAATEVSGTFEFSLGTTYYDLKLDYKDDNTHQKAILQWESALAGPAITKAVVPSTALQQAFHVKGSPTQFTVGQSDVCGTLSIAFGQCLTLGTAGQASTFTVIARDAFNNARTNGVDEFVARVYNAPGTYTSGVIKPTLTNLGTGEHRFSYTTTTMSTHALWVGVLSAGGLYATYYSDTGLVAETFGRADAGVDFSTTGDLLNPGQWPNMGPFTNFGVRWQGFVRAEYDQEYTFYMSVLEADERMKLWVDNSLLIDQWTSIAGTEASGTYTFATRRGMYEIKMEYHEISGDHGVKLQWYTDSVGRVVPKAPIESNRLFQWYHYTLDKFDSVVVMADTCASKSIANPAVLTSYASNTAATITVEAKDIYGNVADTPAQPLWTANFKYGWNFLLYSELSATMVPTVTTYAAGTFQFTFNPLTTPDTRTLAIQLNIAGGLMGHYYREPKQQLLAATRVDSTFDFDWSHNQPHSMIVPDYWSVRWVGQLYPKQTELYTFQTTTTAEALSADGVRLWIGDTLLIDEWDASATQFSGSMSLKSNTFYDVRLDYKDIVGHSSLKMEWKALVDSGDAFVVVPTDRLYHSMAHISGSPFTVDIG